MSNIEKRQEENNSQRWSYLCKWTRSHSKVSKRKPHTYVFSTFNLVWSVLTHKFTRFAFTKVTTAKSDKHLTFQYLSNFSFSIGSSVLSLMLLLPVLQDTPQSQTAFLFPIPEKFLILSIPASFISSTQSLLV